MNTFGYIVIILVTLVGVFWFFKTRFARTALHDHEYKTPIACRYVGFYTRDIIYECPCGSREVFRIYREFGDRFPIPTDNFVSRDQFDELLEGATRAYVGLGPLKDYDD